MFVKATQPPRLRVLLAEDDYDIRESLSRLLEADGYEVLALSNGVELLDYLASWILDERQGSPADVIVTDIRMPGFNGLSIVEGLRAKGWLQPVIVMSAFGDDEIRHRVSRMGKATFFAKPFNPVELEKTITEVASPIAR
ncbi:MAG: response regulator [Myxococcota bacterium]